jgi:hypothetical protein
MEEFETGELNNWSEVENLGACTLQGCKAAAILSNRRDF